MIKKIRYSFFLLLILFLFKGIIYRFLVNYSVIKTRTSIHLTNTTLCNEIDERIKGKTFTINEIIELTTLITSKKLSFTFHKASSNSNYILKEQKANCIGYSSLFNSIGTYILKQKKLTKQYKFTHQVGKLAILGYDIHQFIDSPFFKDHDFNEIEDLKTNVSYFVDPSLNDYFYINYVVCK